MAKNKKNMVFIYFSTGRTICTLCGICLCLHLLFAVTAIAAPSDTNKELLVTFTLKQKPLKDVAAMITKQTGYTVKLEAELSDQLISGEYNSVEVSSFFNRALKMKNIFVIVSPVEKTIVVRTAGLDKGSKLAAKNESESKAFSQSTVDGSAKGFKDNTNLSNSERGGVYELNNNFPIKAPDNDRHLIDSQTGKTWREAEKMLGKE